MLNPKSRKFTSIKTPKIRKNIFTRKVRKLLSDQYFHAAVAMSGVAKNAFFYTQFQESV